MEAMCLTEKQVNQVYKKGEEGGNINMDKLQQELKQKMDREDDNPYKRVVLNKYIERKTKLPKLKIGPYLLTKSNTLNMMERLSIALT